MEDRLIRILRHNYSPSFNENPEKVINEMKDKISSSNGKKRAIYEKLYGHYKNVSKLRDELN